IRIKNAGFKVGLIPEAVVFHKRRTDFKQFYKQLHFFGRARINIYKHFPTELRLVHFFPAFFVLFLCLFILLNIVNGMILSGSSHLLSVGTSVVNILLSGYVLLVFIHAWTQTRNVGVASLSIVAASIQLVAYGLGFMQDF